MTTYHPPESFCQDVHVCQCVCTILIRRSTAHMNFVKYLIPVVTAPPSAIVSWGHQQHGACDHEKPFRCFWIVRLVGICWKWCPVRPAWLLRQVAAGTPPSSAVKMCPSLINRTTQKKKNLHDPEDGLLVSLAVPPFTIVQAAVKAEVVTPESALGLQ